MILLDLTQVMIANLMMQLGNHTNAQVEEPMLRHMILNSIRSYKAKLGREFGELIVCCDSPNQWRKQYFPYYKANRKKSRDSSELDWSAIFKSLGLIRDELKEYAPYRVIAVASAEADDVIATMCMTHQYRIRPGQIVPDDILILSSDKDFIQLHVMDYVRQFNPIKKKFITHPDPASYLHEHVLRGDAGDGVPNVLSPDNCLVIGQKQKAMTQKRLSELLAVDPDKYTELVRRNYHRNRKIIDLREIPPAISEAVISQYHEQASKPTNRMHGYLLKFKLNQLLAGLNDFYVGQ
jgi:hypothetical protein